MASNFMDRGIEAPAHVVSDPAQAMPVDVSLKPGMDHRPFSDEEIKQAFDTFDLDRNRFVGAMELRHILELIGEEATDEEIDEMIRMCDGDGDGQVTYDEFYRLMTQPPAPVAPPLPPGKQRKGARGERKTQFQTGPAKESQLTLGSQTTAGQAAASQKSRATSVEALVRKLSGGMDKIKPSQIKRIYRRFQEIDIDRSGAIEFEEFIMALDIEDNQMSKQMFRIFDLDGSGSIELKEFIVVLSRYTSAAKTEKLKFAFMMFDEDGSGFIERDELIAMLQSTFVIEGYSTEQLEQKADDVFEFLGLPEDAGIGYEDFLKLASAKNGLIYPLEAQERTLDSQNLSMDQALAAARG